LTGYDNGLITIALQEADDVERETRRNAMAEPIELCLVTSAMRSALLLGPSDADENRYDECRIVFGDERDDYGAALKRHYDDGAPTAGRRISSAPTPPPIRGGLCETWAHYLHIADSLETAGAFGLAVHPAITVDWHLHAERG